MTCHDKPITSCHVHKVERVLLICHASFMRNDTWNPLVRILSRCPFSNLKVILFLGSSTCYIWSIAQGAHTLVSQKVFITVYSRRSIPDARSVLLQTCEDLHVFEFVARRGIPWNIFPTCLEELLFTLTKTVHASYALYSYLVDFHIFDFPRGRSLIFSSSVRRSARKTAYFRKDATWRRYSLVCFKANRCQSGSRFDLKTFFLKVCLPSRRSSLRCFAFIAKCVAQHLSRDFASCFPPRKSAEFLVAISLSSQLPWALWTYLCFAAVSLSPI